MCGHGQSCSFSCCCRSCSYRFLRWRQIARPARITAIEFSVRLQYNSEARRGCLRCWLWVSPRDSFITCSIEACIECQIRKCGRQDAAELDVDGLEQDGR